MILIIVIVIVIIIIIIITHTHIYIYTCNYILHSPHRIHHKVYPLNHQLRQFLSPGAAAASTADLRIADLAAAADAAAGRSVPRWTLKNPWGPWGPTGRWALFPPDLV